MRIKQIICYLSASILISSCATNVEELSSDESEIPDQVSFANNIQPIFNGSCGGGGCHINSSASGVNLTDYARVINSRGNQYVSEIVIIGDADASPLVDKIEPDPINGNRMPLGDNPLSPTQIQIIRKWIDQGAMDN